ncbi:MAG: methyltransferase domain-containing protein [Ilumatobacteraceae bacterium]|nr:methyltransferase domain-containing protein [Ilumatobacteraceae bacterium]
MAKWLHSFCVHKADLLKNLKILDVGAGAGEFISDFLTVHGQTKPELYCGIEPLGRHFAALTETVQRLGMDSCSHLFPQDLQDFLDQLPSLSIAGKRFDIILLSHSVYYIQAVGNTLLALQQLLTPHGRIFVILNAEGLLTDLWSYFAEHLPTINKHSDCPTTPKSVVRQAQDAGIPVTEYTIFDTGYTISDLLKDEHMICLQH